MVIISNISDEATRIPNDKQQKLILDDGNRKKKLSGSHNKKVLRAN